MSDLSTWTVDYLTKNGGKASVLTLASDASKAGLGSVPDVAVALESIPAVTVSADKFNVSLNAPIKPPAAAIQAAKTAIMREALIAHAAGNGAFTITDDPAFTTAAASLPSRTFVSIKDGKAAYMLDYFRLGKLPAFEQDDIAATAGVILAELGARGSISRKRAKADLLETLKAQALDAAMDNALAWLGAHGLVKVDGDQVRDLTGDVRPTPPRSIRATASSVKLYTLKVAMLDRVRAAGADGINEYTLSDEFPQYANAYCYTAREALKESGKVVVDAKSVMRLAVEKKPKLAPKPAEPAVVETSAPVPTAPAAAVVTETKKTELTPYLRERLESVVLAGARGARLSAPDSPRIAALFDSGLVAKGGDFYSYVSPVDTDPVAPEVKNACARIVTLLRDRANSLDDLRRELGAETVDLATKRMGGVLIKHSDKGWSRIDGQVRKTEAEQEAAKKARAQETVAKKPMAGPAPAVETTPVSPPTTPTAAAVADRHLASIDANMARMAEMFDVAFKGDDLHEGISVRAGRRPTVKAVSQRIAVVLYLADTVMTETQIRDGLTPQQREKRQAALKMAVSKRAIKAHPAMLGQRTRRYELLDPEPLGLSWDALEAEKESLADRASKKALTEAARRSQEEQERRERVMARVGA